MSVFGTPFGIEFLEPGEHFEQGDVGNDAKDGSRDNRIEGIKVLPKGTSGGLPAVAIEITLGDGRKVIAQTTARLFALAGRAVASRYPEILE